MPNKCQAKALPICTPLTSIPPLDFKSEVPDRLSDVSMAEAAPFPESIANNPAHPLPAKPFSHESDPVLNYTLQCNLANHDSSIKVNAPAMASCQSVPVGAKQPRRVVHSLPRHNTAPPTFTSGSHHAPGSIRRSTAGMHALHTAWSTPRAQCFVTSPSAKAQVFDRQVPQTPQLWHSVQAQPASGDASQSDDSVAISAQHRQAWDASHGSLQSFKKLCRQLQSNHQQSWSIASASDHSSKLPSIMHQQDAPKPSLSTAEYAWPVRQLHKACSVPEAQQPFRCSSSMLPLPARTPPGSPHQLWPPSSVRPKQSLTRASPKFLQSAQRSALFISPQPLQPSFQLDPSAPCIPQQLSPAVATYLPSQTPKAVARFGQVQRPRCVTNCSGSLPMSAAEVEAVHASQLEELQHSTLDWMAANFAGAISRYK